MVTAATRQPLTARPQDPAPSRHQHTQHSRNRKEPSHSQAVSSGSAGRRQRVLLAALLVHAVGSFGAVFTAAGIKILTSPPQAPRANAICERIIGTLRRKLIDRILIVSEHHLRQVLTEYLRHYNTARPHRALGQLTPAQAGTSPPEPVNPADHCIHRKHVLGGLTNEYYAAA